MNLDKYSIEDLQVALGERAYLSQVMVPSTLTIEEVILDVRRKEYSREKITILTYKGIAIIRSVDTYIPELEVQPPGFFGFYPRITLTGMWTNLCKGSNQPVFIGIFQMKMR